MIALLFSACGGSDKGGVAGFGVMNVLKKIPSDASVVAVMNVGQLMNKLDYKSFKETELFKKMLEEAKSDDAKKILEDPDAAGIATNGQFCMYVQVKGKDNAVGAILMPIKDVKVLEALFEKSAKEKDDCPFKNIQDAKDYKFVEDKKDDMKIGVAWDKKMLALTFSAETDLKTVFAEIFDTKRTESILTNKQFKSDKAADHDFMIWMQSDPILALAKADEKMLNSLKQSLFFTGLSVEDLNENSIAAFYDFNKGEMEGGVSYHMNKKIEEEFGAIFKKSIKTDFSSYFPAKNMISISMMGFDTKGIYEVLNKRSLDGMADAQLSSMGLTVKEIMDGLDGDMAVATYINPEAGEKGNMQQAVIAIAFKKPELLDKLLELANATGVKITRTGNRISAADMADKGGAVFVNNVLVLSNNTAILDQIEKGGYKGAETLAKEHYKTMSKGWMGAHIDYSSIVASASSISSMRNFGEMFEMLGEYNELESGTFTATTETAKMMVFLKNKSENSLKVLMNVANKVYVDRDKIEEKMKGLQNPESDTDEDMTDKDETSM